jgi:hypothetical protein
MGANRRLLARCSDRQSGMGVRHDGDGTLVRTNLKLTTPTLMDVSITVDFQRDLKLELWVPSRMEERYDDSGESTTCSARYSNFRRFETSGRLVTPE